MEESQS